MRLVAAVHGRWYRQHRFACVAMVKGFVMNVITLLDAAKMTVECAMLASKIKGRVIIVLIRTASNAAAIVVNDARRLHIAILSRYCRSCWSRVAECIMTSTLLPKLPGIKAL